MLDAREPKNGDFARYVEELTRHPPLPRHVEASAVEAPAAPPTPGAATATPGAATAQPPGRSHATESLAATLRAIATARSGKPRAPGSESAWGHSAAPATAHSGATAPGDDDARPSPASIPPALAQAIERATHASPQARAEARATLSKLLERIAAVAVFAGIAMIATSFSDDPPFFADPFTGIVLLVGAGMANRLRKKLTA